MEKLTREQIDKFIQDGNLRFEAAEPWERKVMVAADVLDQLATSRLDARRGTYFRPAVVWGDEVGTGTAEGLAQGIMCVGCAKGGLLIGFFRVFNHAPDVELVDLDDEISWDGEHLEESMRGVFTADELNRFEEIFESGYEWGEGFSDQNKLAAICFNIWENKGNFDESQEPHRDALQRWTKMPQAGKAAAPLPDKAR